MLAARSSHQMKLNANKRAAGDLVLHFTLLADDMTPKARACFIFASRAAQLPRKHCPDYGIGRVQKHNSSLHSTSHVVSTALANPEAHALIRSSCFEPPNMPGTPAARDQTTRAYAFRPQQAAQRFGDTGSSDSKKPLS